MRCVKPSQALLASALVLALGAPGQAFERLQTRGRRLSTSGDLLIVSAPERDRVVLYDAHGERLRKLGEFGGEQGASPGFLMAPHGALALASGELAVVDTFNQRLQFFDLRAARAGLRPRLLRTLGRPGREPAEFDTPVSGLAASSAPELDGLLFVADTGNRRVQVFDRERRFVRAWEVTEGDARPSDVAFDRGGRVLFVGQAGAARISAFDALTGARLFAFAGCDGDALGMPAGLALAPDGDLWVADRVRRRVLRLRPENGSDGRPRALRCVSSFGRYGAGPGEFQYPQAVAVDARGRVYVCDQADDRCQAFSPEGAFLFAFADDLEPPEWAAPAPDASRDDGTARVLCSGAGRYGLRLAGRDAPLPRNEPFDLQLELTRGCAADAPVALEGDVELRFEAFMPRHRHGLVTQPRVRALGAGRFVLEGVLLHMAGLWELHFDLWRERGRDVERAQWDVELP